MRELWTKIHPSIFSLTFSNAEGRITSGTGFKVGEYLVTNNHVIQLQNARRIHLRSVQADGHSPSVEVQFGHLEFRQMLVDGDPEAGWDYAILRIPRDEFAAVSSLTIAPVSDVSIGAAVALFGFQFEQPNLSMHQGYVSSQFHRAGVHYLQLDSSVNHGNSGGPLIDINSGNVIGIVTRKATGLTEQFDGLLQSFRENIKQVEGLQGAGGIAIGGIDVYAATLAAQRQMERIAIEIGRSANVGIGYAYDVGKVRESLTLLA